MDMLFAQLTVGSCAALRADDNDAGEAVLVGVRTGEGQLLSVAAMSDGRVARP